MLRRLAIWFIAGFLAVLVFHQGMLAILYGIGFTPYAPLPMQPTAPLGIPQLFSLAFWGGVWGLLLGLIEPRLPRGWLYWLIVAIFGAIGPTAVAVLVVFPLKGIAPPSDAPIAGLITGLLINGAWGVGTVLIFRLAGRLFAR
jgi:hypothetical protein